MKPSKQTLKQYQRLLKDAYWSGFNYAVASIGCSEAYLSQSVEVRHQKLEDAFKRWLYETEYS